MGKQHPQYYTAREAQSKLGLSRSLFYKRAKQGLIPRRVLPGKKTGLYPKRDIDALALSTTPVVNPYIFSASSPADQMEERLIGIRCFGSAFITSLVDRISFQQKNKFTFHSLKVHGKVVAYISLFRLPASRLDDLLSGRMLEREIGINNVLPFTRLEDFSVYIDVIAVDPALPQHLQRLYAGMLIFHFISLLCKLIESYYPITHLYTVTVSDEGEKLSRQIGFQLLEGKSLLPTRKAFIYTLDEQGRANIHDLLNTFHVHFSPSAREEH